MKTTACFQLQLNTDNAAFDDYKCGEIARVLRRLADDIDLNGLSDSGCLYDINGNRIGHWGSTR